MTYQASTKMCSSECPANYKTQCATQAEPVTHNTHCSYRHTHPYRTSLAHIKYSVNSGQTDFCWVVASKSQCKGSPFFSAAVK